MVTLTHQTCAWSIQSGMHVIKFLLYSTPSVANVLKEGKYNKYFIHLFDFHLFIHLFNRTLLGISSV